MASTPNVGFPEVDPMQIGKTATIDTALEAIDQVMGATLTLAANALASPYPIPYNTGDEPNVVKTAIRFAYLKITGATGGTWTVYLPAGPSFRFLVKNLTTHSVVVKVSGQTGVTLASGNTQDMFLDGTDVIAAGTAF
jgi:hypothetical protein